MARLAVRRNRDSDDEGDDISRETTPLSTAPEDRKRLRRSNAVEEHDDTDYSDISSDRPGRGSGPRSRKDRRSSAAALAVRGNALRPKHQPGAILRVKLTNFVTYTVAEFFPGPNLNMVIGPNGTGKSTLVCAICLGLGWGPQLLGRAKDPAEFIKHGCQEARIEIELQRATTGPMATKTNPIFKRRIRKDGKSEFHINERSTSNKQILELARDFNIQIDNLCQFLPQDRVVEFAQMTPVQMLESTMKAAVQPQTLEYFENLKGLREQQQELQSNNRGDRETLEGLEKRQESQRADVDRMKERLVILKQIEWLEKCRPVLKYKDLRLKLREQTAIKNDLLRTVQRLTQDSGPILEKLEAKKTYRDAAIDNQKQADGAVAACEGTIKTIEKEIADLTSGIEEKSQLMAAEKNDIKKQKEIISQQRIAKTNLIAKKQVEPEPYDIRTANEEIRELTAKKRGLDQKLSDITDRGRILKEEHQAKKERKKTYQNELDNLQTQQGQQEDKLKQISLETYQAWDWIKQNQDKFRQPVFGPPIVELTLTDLNKADAIESMLRKNHFTFITAQCKEDFALLQQELTTKKRLHDISLRTFSDEASDRFHPPLSQEQLHELGLENWAIEYLSGPRPVLAMLCENTNLHQCAISSRDVTQQQHDAIAASSIKSYIAAGKLNKFIKRAEYGTAGTSTSTSDLRKAKFWTDKPLNTTHSSNLTKQIATLNGELTDIQEAGERIKRDRANFKTELSDIDQSIQKVIAERNKNQTALTEYKALDTKIEHCEEKIRKAQEATTEAQNRTTGLGQEKDEQLFAKAEMIIKYCDATHELTNLNGKLLEAEMALIEARSDSESLQEINRNILSDVKSKESEARAAEKACEDINAEARVIHQEVRALKDEAETLQQQGESGLFDLWQAFGSPDGERAETTTEQLNDELDIEHSKLALTEGGNTNSIQEFEERARKITKLREKLASFREGQDNLISAIKEVRQHFEADLDPIVAKINDAFADSFARIGCAGQVTVFKAPSADPADCTEDLGGTENGLDFENWAIHISVKFRESEPLSLLDSHRQSGGERAVSTIFYLMALQSLSRSPFRVVDEINQGMDPRNERMVHGRMVDIAAADETNGSQGSQYFLITPKLLSGLKYRRGMTVLCIVSGENMPKAEPGKTMDFAEFARKARELGYNSPVGRRADSGVSFASSMGASGSSQVRVSA